MFINDKNIKIPEDPNTIVWKYLDLSKFVDLLLYKKLFLSLFISKKDITHDIIIKNI